MYDELPALHKLHSECPGDKVAEFRLSENNLTGPVPRALLKFKFLVTVDLSGNALTGGLPVWLGELMRTESINLSRNKLTGGIPEGYTAAALVVTSVADNPGMKGAVPPALVQAVLDLADAGQLCLVTERRLLIKACDVSRGTGILCPEEWRARQLRPRNSNFMHNSRYNHRKGEKMGGLPLWKDTDSYSFAAWIRPDPPPNEPVPKTFVGALPVVSGLGGGMCQLRLEMIEGSKSGYRASWMHKAATGAYSVTAQTVIPTDRLTHVAVCQESQSRFKLWINGVLVANENKQWVPVADETKPAGVEPRNTAPIDDDMSEASDDEDNGGNAVPIFIGCVVEKGARPLLLYSLASPSGTLPWRQPGTSSEARRSRGTSTTCTSGAGPSSPKRSWR